MSVTLARTRRDDALRTELTRLCEDNGGRLSPRGVLEAARDESSPLHDEFEWDDSAAAEAFRLVQAGALIRRVRLKVEVTASEPTRVEIRMVRAFPSMPSLRGAESGSYIPISNADPSELVRDALRQLESVRRRYEHLQDLAPVWEAIRSAAG